MLDWNGNLVEIIPHIPMEAEILCLGFENQQSWNEVLFLNNEIVMPSWQASHSVQNFKNLPLCGEAAKLKNEHRLSCKG